MIPKHLFRIIKNQKGLTGIKYQHINGVVAIICHSPYASPRSKVWLEQEMIKLYDRYYKRVYRESMGEFFPNESVLFTLRKEEF